MIYLLIVCVAGVWGIIFSKIYSGLNTEEDFPVLTGKNKKVDYFNLTDHISDTFDRATSYRDPFSVEEVIPEEKVSQEIRGYSGIVPAAPINTKPPVNWSVVKYSGYISNPMTKQKVAIMYINGKEAMLSEGQSAEGLKLIRFAGDSVKVSYQQATKYILIK